MAGERLFIAALVVVAAGLIGVGVSQGYTWRLLALPLVCSVAIIALSLGHARRPAVPKVPRVAAGKGWQGMGYGMGLVAAVGLLGFPLGLALYSAWVLRWQGYGWRTAVLVAILAAAVTEGLFRQLLGVPLPRVPLGY
ncbi:MAG: tripartite tricarboxylate transporter TctB family protein [Candidatus Competibacterales bacterium]